MNPPAHPHVERVDILILWFACTSEFMVMVNYWRSLRVVQGPPYSHPLRQCWRAPTGHRPARDLLSRVIQPRVEYDHDRVRCAMGFKRHGQIYRNELREEQGVEGKGRHAWCAPARPALQ